MMKIKEVRKDFANLIFKELNEEQVIKLSELLNHGNIKPTYHYVKYDKEDFARKYKLQYLSFLNALMSMGDITYKQYETEANKYTVYVSDVLNTDGTFKAYLNYQTIDRLKKYFDDLQVYKMSDVVPLSAF